MTDRERAKAVVDIVFDMWMCFATGLGWLVTLVGPQYAAVVMTIFTLPFLFRGTGKIARLIRGSQIDFGILPPAANTTRNREMTTILKRLHTSIGLPVSDELRVTTFVPDSKNERLVQVARYCWNGIDVVSDTRIRIGVCAVGHAYNLGEFWHVRDVALDGGFLLSLMRCGLTREEVTSQHLERRSFAAAPIFFTDSNHKMRVLCVVAIDSGTPDVLPDDFPLKLQPFENEIRRALLPSWRSPLPASGEPPPGSRGQALKALAGKSTIRN